MAGTLKTIDTASAIVANRTANVMGQGAHAALTVYVDVTAITRTTGTLDVEVRWSPDGSATSAQIASVTGITAPGRFRMTLNTNFDDTRVAIPEPNRVVWTLNGDATAVSGTILAHYGD